MIRENNLLLLLQALVPLGIGVATGEMCQNRVMFKQFLKANAMQYCQIDACRLGGVNEVLAVILLAAKFNGLSWTLKIHTLLYNKSWVLSLPVNCNQIQIPGSEICCSPREDSKFCNFTLYKRVPICSFSVPVCPHAGGVALCELVQHLSMFDFVCVSGTMENRFVYSLFFSE